jgi:hypothetical protein
MHDPLVRADRIGMHLSNGQIIPHRRARDNVQAHHHARAAVQLLDMFARHQILRVHPTAIRRQERMLRRRVQRLGAGRGLAAMRRHIGGWCLADVVTCGVGFVDGIVAIVTSSRLLSWLMNTCCTGSLVTLCVAGSYACTVSPTFRLAIGTSPVGVATSVLPAKLINHAVSIPRSQQEFLGLALTIVDATLATMHRCHLMHHQ